MLLDAQKSLPIEVEVIFGEVVRLAREFNVPVPVGFGQTAIHSTYSAPAD
jgi:ketopantoate reductase